MIDRVMLIGGDTRLRKLVEEACGAENVHALHAASYEAVSPPAASGERPSEIVLCDYETFPSVRSDWPTVGVLLIDEPSSSDTTIEAIKQGALDFLVRPTTVASLARQIRDALRISRAIELPAERDETHRDSRVERIIGQSPAMTELYKLVALIAPRDINVLITGESGTGKELVARAILHHSPRRDHPYLAVNCAAIPETLLESELFGHEKGAFTGATSRRLGKFEQCDGGTLFLDEVGDIPLPTQAKLLRVLQDGSFQRLGSSQTQNCDVRIISATHQPLETMIREQRFRRDLYYRFRVASVEVPPLREREVDVVLLAHYFVRRYNALLGTEIRSFAPDTLPLLLRYPWPGNVRELENAIKSALVVARGTILLPEFLPDHIRAGTPAAAEDAIPDSRAVGFETLPLRQLADRLIAGPSFEGRVRATALDVLDRELVRAALERHAGRLAPAARQLGISRATLRQRVRQLGLETEFKVAGIRSNEMASD